LNNNNIKFTPKSDEMGNMTRRERLTATLRGEPVDRPAVNFYEIGGFLVNPDDPDEYNIYNSPSWKPLLDLAEERTDIIRLVSPVTTAVLPDRPLRSAKRSLQVSAGGTKI
jgi:hypothetical protein